MFPQTKILLFVSALILSAAICVPAAERRTENPDAKLHKFSTIIEKERPQLSAETQALIAEFRKNPTEANRLALRHQVEIRYDEVLARKKAKLEELKRTAKHDSKIREMQEIVDEMVRDRENRIDQTMRRFADPRLRPDARNATDGFLPVIGAAENIFIAREPVTNADYAQFVAQTGAAVPANWKNGKPPAGSERVPVTNISSAEAAAYCDWLTRRSRGNAKFRLPTEAEWEQAAGHMPKDADFNCGENPGPTPVDAYAGTLSAAGAVDMWGNCWEWTSTPRGTKGGAKILAVKGGAWNSPRTDCRTEYRGEGRAANARFANVGFRVVRED